MRARRWLSLGYFLLATGGLTGLLFRAELTRPGLVLSLPRGLFWTLFWAALTFLVMLAVLCTEPPEGKGE